MQKENVKILKRAEQALRNELSGLIAAGPSREMNQTREIRGSGSGMNRPPDPPDPNKKGVKLPECPSTETYHQKLGENGEGAATAIEGDRIGDVATESATPVAGTASGDVAMEEAVATSRDVEVVRATQF